MLTNSNMGGGHFKLNCHKNKGFTLIELISVIILMGVIALITVPIIKDTIESSREKNFKNSALGLIEAANEYYLNSKLTGDYFEEIEFKVNNGKMISGDKELSFNGKVPVGDSYVKIKANGDVAINITDGEFYAVKDYDEVGASIGTSEDTALLREELIKKINELEKKVDSNTTSIENNKLELDDKINSNKLELDNKIGNNTTNINNNKTELENKINTNFDKIYPVGSIFRSTNSTNPSTIYGGSWTLLSKRVIDTGWQDFSWTNSTYVGTTQSSYTQNKWRIMDNILYVQVGAGATSTIDTSTELEIARIPIKNTIYKNANQRVWIGAVGGGGATAGFIARQWDDYLSINIKPHTSTNAFVTPWYSSHLTIPLDNDFIFVSGSYEYEYKWKRNS